MNDPSDKPTPTCQIQWPRFVIEGVVIVASILLAFGIEAWWENRQERQDEVVASTVTMTAQALSF